LAYLNFLLTHYYVIKETSKYLRAYFVVGDMMSAEVLSKKILAKLHKHGYIGKRHTSIDNVPKGFPKHLRGEIMKATKRLIREGLIIAKSTAYGLQISLHPHRMAEIERIIRDP